MPKPKPRRAAREHAHRAAAPPPAPAPAPVAVPKARKGRPPYEPTAEQRKHDAGQVVSMVLADTKQDMIARVLGIGTTTLRREYRRELDTTYAVILAEIGGGVITAARPVSKAQGGDGTPRDLKAAMFYLETHGWVKSERLIMQDADADADPATLSDQQIAERLAKLRRRAVLSGTPAAKAVPK